MEKLYLILFGDTEILRGRRQYRKPAVLWNRSLGWFLSTMGCEHPSPRRGDLQWSITLIGCN